MQSVPSALRVHIDHCGQRTAIFGGGVTGDDGDLAYRIERRSNRDFRGEIIVIRNAVQQDAHIAGAQTIDRETNAPGSAGWVGVCGISHRSYQSVGIAG